MFREVLKDLNAGQVAANDLRAPMAVAFKRLTELMIETLQMESNIVDGKPVPADPVRAEAINAEFLKINAQLPKIMEQLKLATKR